MRGETAQALQDCREALAMAISADSDQHRRILWIGARALLRDVGDCLRKTAPNEAYSEATYRSFLTWRADRLENRIFWDFINVTEHADVDLGDFEPQVSRYRTALRWWEKAIRRIDEASEAMMPSSPRAQGDGERDGRS